MGTDEGVCKMTDSQRRYLWGNHFIAQVVIGGGGRPAYRSGDRHRYRSMSATAMRKAWTALYADAEFWKAFFVSLAEIDAKLSPEQVLTKKTGEYSGLKNTFWNAMRRKLY